MKYNININQKALGKTELDLKDAAILDYLIMYCNSKSEKIDKQRIAGATWINYQALIDDMPLLKITSRNAITPRIKKIEEAGYIITKLRTVKGNKRLFVKLTDKVDSLFVELTEPVREKEKPVRETVHNNNTIDNTTKDYKVVTKLELPSFLGTIYLDRIYQFYSMLWKDKYGMYPKRNYAKDNKLIKALHQDYSEYQIALLIMKHFEWRGATGSDEFTHKRLVDACFPIDWIPNSVNAYIASITNTDGIKFEDEDACRIVVDKYLKI